MLRFNPFISIAAILLAITILGCPINGSASARKLDETTPPSDDPIKCTPSCLQSPPPPSPPPPSPPPPACPPPPALPPPKPKKPPSTAYCPPPPATFLYMTGPPGDLYTVDQNFGAAPTGRSPMAMEILVFIACGYLVLFVF